MDDAYILSQLDTAKQKKLDMGVIYHTLGDHFGVTDKAIKTRASVLRRRRRRDPDFLSDVRIAGSVAKVEVVEQRITSGESLVDKVKQVVEERDLYKSMYEQTKAELDAIQQLLK